MTGKVYIASMNMRGKWAQPTIDNYVKINVTSSQSKKSKNRLAFSPMNPIDGGYKGFYCFENYWQAGKVYEGIDRDIQLKWWREIKEPKRRYKGSKGKKVLHAVFGDNDKEYDYITSRKEIYVPEYYNLIKDQDMVKYWQNQLENGENLIIYDFDGPRKDDGEVLCLNLDNNLLIEKINDTKHPFGHGYIVGATILGIGPDKYI